MGLWTFGPYGVTSAKTKMPIIRKVRAILMSMPMTMPSQVAMPTLRARMRSRS